MSEHLRSEARRYPCTNSANSTRGIRNRRQPASSKPIRGMQDCCLWCWTTLQIDEGIGLEGNHTSQDLLGPISANGEAGISVITASMNRNENLLRALPSWLRLPEVSEVVIVDWSSKEPVREALKRLPKPDSRIKVARVTNAPRWSAPCAFNAGIRLTKCRRILKLDADIVLSKDFLTVNGIPGENEFIAGNWRNVSDDQQHVNGSFLAPSRSTFQNWGYSEFFTTYGWEDDEIYDRLQASGLKRKDVDTTTMLHLPHSDAERTGDTTSGKPPPERPY
jgi:GT2 family glycosyltransferase